MQSPSRTLGVIYCQQTEGTLILITLYSLICNYSSSSLFQSLSKRVREIMEANISQLLRALLLTCSPMIKVNFSLQGHRMLL